MTQSAKILMRQNDSSGTSVGVGGWEGGGSYQDWSVEIGGGGRGAWQPLLSSEGFVEPDCNMLTIHMLSDEANLLISNMMA